MGVLEHSGKQNYRLYKGDASYFSTAMGGARSSDPIWTYHVSLPAVAAIKDHLTFYRDPVGAIE